MLKTNRIEWLDECRGLSVIFMIIFHFTYDLNLFHLVSIDFYHGFWYAFPRFIAGLFLFCVGISLESAHTPKIQFKPFKKRLMLLVLGATIVSISTYIQYPDQWVYFGTLHCIATASLLGLLFVGRPWAQFFLALIIIISQYYFDYDIKWVSGIIEKPSIDFIPIYPWFWVVLSGMLFKRLITFNQSLLPKHLHHLCCNLGRHSLIIYLIHQPLLFSIAWLIFKLV